MHFNKPNPPTAASLRRMMRSILKSDSVFDAFCIDYLPEIYRNFTNGMDRLQKENCLITSIEPQELFDKISEFVLAKQENTWPANLAVRRERSLSKDDYPTLREDYVMVLSGTVKEDDISKIRAIAEHLRNISADMQLTITAIRRGSVIIMFQANKYLGNGLVEMFIDNEFSKVMDMPVILCSRYISFEKLSCVDTVFPNYDNENSIESLAMIILGEVMALNSTCKIVALIGRKRLESLRTIVKISEKAHSKVLMLRGEEYQGYPPFEILHAKPGFTWTPDSMSVVQRFSLHHFQVIRYLFLDNITLFDESIFEIIQKISDSYISFSCKEKNGRFKDVTFHPPMIFLSYYVDDLSSEKINAAKEYIRHHLSRNVSIYKIPA